MKQQTSSASDDAACYRLLGHNDTIRADDEFLEDDCQTWTLIGIQHRWNVGCYWHTALKPMRRILGDNVSDQLPTGRAAFAGSRNHNPSNATPNAQMNPPGKLPKARCPVCGENRALTKSGEIRFHGWTKYRPAYCKGSNATPMR